MARQGETAALDDQRRYRVDNLTLLVRQAALEVFELVPAATTDLPAAIVEHLADHRDLSAADLAAALDAEPRHVNRALTALVVEEQVVASGKGGGCGTGRSVGACR